MNNESPKRKTKTYEAVIINCGNNEIETIFDPLVPKHDGSFEFYIRENLRLLYRIEIRPK